MAEEFTMPKLGLTMTDGTIQEWLVPDGTPVAAGDPVLVIETDKVETEVEARIGGVLQIAADVGENYECGQVIGYLLAEGEAPQAVAAAAAGAPEVAAAPTADVPAPAPAASVAATPASANGAVDIAARGDGGRILASPRARATARASGADLAGIAGTGPNGRIVHDDVVAAAAASGGLVVADVAARGEGGRILASPRARATARTHGAELAHIAGSGPNGRIVHDDVVAYAERLAAQPAPTVPAAAAGAAVAGVGVAAAATAGSSSAPAAVAAVPSAAGSGTLATAGGRMLAELLGVDLALVAPPSSGARVTRNDVAAWVRARLSEGTTQAVAVSTPPAGPALVALAPATQQPTEVIALRGMRGIIAERMHQSLQQMAQLTLAIDVDMGAVNAERAQRKERGDNVPGYTAWVVSAAAQALKLHPYVNSQIIDDGVAYLPEIHVGVAVALDDGLLVPVIEHADVRSVEDTHAAVADLSGRARNRKLSPGELEGSTFSVTALGMYGVDVFTPVINPPNTAILGVGRLRTETAWSDGRPEPRTVMTLSLTWDHRAFDGAPAAEFAQTIVRLLENPGELE